jgi:methyl-accepting chemotaxis protein
MQESNVAPHNRRGGQGACEAGRGFAVVAAEVKALANQTTNATHDVSGMIGEIGEIAASIMRAMPERGSATSAIASGAGAAAKRVRSAAMELSRQSERLRGEMGRLFAAARAA